MPTSETRRTMLGIACSCLLLAGSAGAVVATQDEAEGLRTEELSVAHIQAKNGLLVLRILAGTREVEIRDSRTLSIHDTPAKLLLARQVLELLDHPRSVSQLQGERELENGTMLASFALRDTSARDAMRMLMSKIGIRAVACVEENETVLFRDTREQVEAAFDLLAEFDRVVP